MSYPRKGDINYNRPKRPLTQSSPIAEQAAAIGSAMRGRKDLADRHASRMRRIDQDIELDKTFAFRK